MKRFGMIRGWTWAKTRHLKAGWQLQFFWDLASSQHSFFLKETGKNWRDSRYGGLSISKISNYIKNPATVRPFKWTFFRGKLQILDLCVEIKIVIKILYLHHFGHIFTIWEILVKRLEFTRNTAWYVHKKAGNWKNTFQLTQIVIFKSFRPI